MKQTTRREFMKQAGATALVAAVSPAPAAPATDGSEAIPPRRPIDLPGASPPKP